MRSYTSTVEGQEENTPEFADNVTLSVIIRFHAGGCLKMLEEALFSLAIQEYQPIEIAIMVQNGTPNLERAIRGIMDGQPWAAPPQIILESFHFGRNVDGRTRLINEAFTRITGRFFCFLDYDDVVYQHGYDLLIEQLKKSGKAIAIGGCRRSESCAAGHGWHVIKKEMFHDKEPSRMKLFRDNYVPIHSYVVDRKRLRKVTLRFNEKLTRCEDYEFLLRVVAANEPDFEHFSSPVCEYRIRLDGSNSVVTGTNDTSVDRLAIWRAAADYLANAKRELTCAMTVADLAAESQKSEDAIDHHRRIIEDLQEQLGLAHLSLHSFSCRTAIRLSRFVNQLGLRSIARMLLRRGQKQPVLDAAEERNPDVLPMRRAA